MSTQVRIKQLEKRAPKSGMDAPVYQCVTSDGVKVRWQSGRVTVQAEAMQGLKTYYGISPDEWHKSEAKK